MSQYPNKKKQESHFWVLWHTWLIRHSSNGFGSFEYPTERIQCHSHICLGFKTMQQLNGMTLCVGHYDTHNFLVLWHSRLIRHSWIGFGCFKNISYYKGISLTIGGFKTMLIAVCINWVVCHFLLGIMTLKPFGWNKNILHLGFFEIWGGMKLDVILLFFGWVLLFCVLLNLVYWGFMFGRYRIGCFDMIHMFRQKLLLVLYWHQVA